MSETSTECCSNCGTVLEADDLFCPDCGKKNKGSVSGEKSKGSVKDQPQAKKKQSEFSNIKGKALIDLMYAPLCLSEFHSRYPFLATGPDSQEYELAVERGCNATKKQPEILRIQSTPRFWALQKPGMFRRLLTIFVDLCIWGGMFMAGLVFLIGSHKSGGMVRTLAMGESLRPIFALLWFVISCFIYTAVAEAYLGSTIGGFVAGTRVVNPYGNNLTLGEATGRQFLKFLSPILFIFGPGNSDYEVVLA